MTGLRTILGQAGIDLRAHPLRAGLTLAGFAISMAIAVVLVSAGMGLQDTVGRVLRSLGEGQIVADPGRTTGIGGVSRSGRRVQIRYKDIEGIGTAMPSFESFAPYLSIRGGGASSWKYSIPWSPVRAVGRDYDKVRGFPIIEGRWFSDEEVEAGEWVAVLNEGLRRMIFRDHEAIGQWIDWRGRRMQVVGVVRDEVTFPYYVFIPYKTASQMADARYISGIVARPLPGADWDRAVGEIRRVLAGLGGFDASDPNALEIEDNREFNGKVRAVSLALYVLVLTIAGVSLFLGGLGIANMMVISVTERTREFGIRKALGATPKSIFGQVIAEAAALVLVGGVLGLGLGFFACRLVGELQLSAEYDSRLELSPAVAVACLLALALVGFLSATIPARRAARLTPVEALRWE